MDGDLGGQLVRMSNGSHVGLHSPSTTDTDIRKIILLTLTNDTLSDISFINLN